MGPKYLSSNPIFPGCMNHIEVDYHFVHDQLNNQVADGFTKALPHSDQV
jgi:hypothetical protein